MNKEAICQVKRSEFASQVTDMRYLLLLPFLHGCAVADMVIDNTNVYCSPAYKMARSATRSVMALTAGISLPDACDVLEIEDAGQTEETS